MDQSQDPDFRAARQAELHTVEQTLEGLNGKASRSNRWRRPPYPLIWGILLAAVALAGIRFVLADRATASHPDMAPVSATLSVLADPMGATFWLLDPTDESVLRRAVADGQRSEWPPGDYRVRVEHPDCPDPWNRDIELPPGGSKVYAPRLCQGEGELIVRGKQDEDRLRIDGFDAGSTGENVHTLRTGKHRVHVEKEGFKPWEAEVAIRPGETLSLLAALQLQPTPEAEQKVAASAAPAAASRPPGAVAPSAAPGRLPPEPGWAGDKERAVPPAGSGLGGSKTWHDAIKHELVRTYDRNGSGSLDSPAEIRSIPCAVWRDIETQYETGGLAVEMTHLYGFDGSEAPANTLGITYGQRGEAYQRMKECGLKARS